MTAPSQSPVPNVAAFAYHDVTDEPGSSGFQRPAAVPYKLTVQTFRRHLDSMADGAEPRDLITEIDLRRSGSHLMLTFDDGGRSALVIADELERRGWKGHFFITTGRIGARGFLDAPAVRTLHDAGHLVGSHSHSHPDIFRELADDQMRAEWRDSCRRLEDITGAPVVAASLPGGDASERAFRSAADSGLQYLFTSDPILQPRPVGDCWVIGRYTPKIGTDVAFIRRLAHFEAWGWALLVRRLKDAGRLAFPTLYRAYVRQATREYAR